jgi:rhodanese-related sulfurtransferase
MCQNVNPYIFRDLKEKTNVQLIDVRTPKERFEEGSIPGHLLIDVQKENFIHQVGELDQHKTYLVYCKSGKRSEKACELMTGIGFKDVVNLEGGFEKWKLTFNQ